MDFAWPWISCVALIAYKTCRNYSSSKFKNKNNYGPLIMELYPIILLFKLLNTNFQTIKYFEYFKQLENKSLKIVLLILKLHTTNNNKLYKIYLNFMFSTKCLKILR